MRVIIDRFEGEQAVVEIAEGMFCDLPRRLLPEEAREGDVIQITIDRAATEERRQQLTRLVDELFLD